MCQNQTENYYCGYKNIIFTVNLNLCYSSPTVIFIFLYLFYGGIKEKTFKQTKISVPLQDILWVHYSISKAYDDQPLSSLHPWFTSKCCGLDKCWYVNSSCHWIFDQSHGYQVFRINSKILLYSHLILKLIPFQCAKLCCYLCNANPKDVNKSPKLRFQNSAGTDFSFE